MVNYFIEKGAEVKNVEDELTHLMMAIHLGYDKQVCRYLIEHGDDVNANVRDITPLALAIIRGDESLVKFLLEHGVDVNQELDGKTPLHHVIQDGNIAMIRCLINLGADINKIDSEGISPLSFLKSNISLFPENDRDELVKFFVKKGAVELPNLSKIRYSGT